MTYPVPDNERMRVEALRRLGLIGSPPEPEFDAVVKLACDIFKAPIALVSLLDDHQQWFKAVRGLDVCSTERESAFCNYPVASGDLLIVDDAGSDARFSSNRLVTGGPLIRFYAGVPLSIDPGVHLGTLCVIDTKPRQFTAADVDQLMRLGEIVMALLRQYRSARELEEKNRSLCAQAEELARSKKLFDRASELTRMGAWEWAPDTDELTWTDGMYDIHELPRGSSITSEQIHSLYPDETRWEIQRLLRGTSAETGGRYTFEGPMVTAKGGKRWVRLVGDVECENGVAVRRFGVKQDITAQKALWDRMRFLAECDPLTGLANRSTLQKHLRRTGRAKDQSQKSLVMFLIDLDGFKHLNDTFGHSVGDECLKQIARRLRRVCRGTEMVARLGGDEFALLLDASRAEVSPEQCAELALAELRRPIRWDGQSFQLSGSIGVATTNGVGSRSSQLFTEADLALYVAKGAGRNTFRVFSPDMKASADARYDTIRNITRALNTNELELFYQPKMNLAKGALSGFEALLRWRRPDGQVIPAGAFTAALEDPELSDRIGDWVIEEAINQAREWDTDGHDFGHIAINLSSGHFRDAGFASRFVNQIADSGLRPGMIEVEVTEGVFLSQEGGTVRRILESFREAGIRIALDDFGTGYASLSHLRTYPVDIIKIDRSFVQHFLTSVQDHAIVQSTLFLARHLRLDVVAEGIEEAEQCEFLRALGCQFGQGYLYSRAICADEAREWTPLRDQRRACA